MASRPLLTPGRSLLLLANLAYSIGAFLADFNETHVYNDLWPAHAKFHNGQTMSLGVLLSLTSLYFAFRPYFTGSSNNVEAARDVGHAAVVGSLYCLAGLSAIWYPGADWKDPNVEVGGGQVWLFSGLIGIIWMGFGLERRRLGKVKEG